jgi:hypothetical protein
LSDDGPSFAGGKITKWSLVNGTWILNDTITADVGNTAPSFYWLNGLTDASGNDRNGNDIAEFRCGAAAEWCQSQTTGQTHRTICGLP